MSDQRNFTVHVHHNADHVVATPVGSASSEVAEILKQKLAAIHDENPTRVILDMSQLNYVTSVALGTLISFVEKRQKAGGKVQFVSLQPDVSRILEIAHLDTRMELYPNIAEALNH